VSGGVHFLWAKQYEGILEKKKAEKPAAEAPAPEPKKDDEKKDEPAPAPAGDGW